MEAFCTKLRHSILGLVPGHTRPSQTSIYTEFVPRTNSSVSGGGGSEYHGSSKRDSMQAFTGEIDFPHHEHILERGRWTSFQPESSRWVASQIIWKKTSHLGILKLKTIAESQVSVEFSPEYQTWRRFFWFFLIVEFEDWVCCSEIR